MLGFTLFNFYKILVEWFFSLEIPRNTKIGKNLYFFHGQALVIINQVIIGENCTIRHCATIENKQQRCLFIAALIIGNHVDRGSNVCISGSITIKNSLKTGSGSVVVKDAEANSTLVKKLALENKENYY